MTNMQTVAKRIFNVGEDLFMSIFKHLETQAVKDVLPLVDGMRAIAAEHQNQQQAALLGAKTVKSENAIEKTEENTAATEAANK